MGSYADLAPALKGTELGVYFPRQGPNIQKTINMVRGFYSIWRMALFQAECKALQAITLAKALPLLHTIWGASHACLGNEVEISLDRSLAIRAISHRKWNLMDHAFEGRLRSMPRYYEYCLR